MILVTPTGRRTAAWALGPLTALLVVLVAGTPSMAAETPPDAISSTINAVIRILVDEELKKPGRSEQRRRQIEKAVRDRVSYKQMAKRSLGAQWKTLNDGEKREFAELFGQLVRVTFASRIDDYSDEQVEYLSERIEGSYAEVRTRLKGSNVEIQVGYRMVNKDGDWRVYDIVADGVSLVKNYRAQFTKIIRDFSYAVLVEKLREKSSEPKSFETK